MLLALRLASSIGMFARGSKNSKVLAALRLEFTRPCAWAGTTISTFDANAIQTGKAAPPNVAAFFLFVGEMTVPRVCRQAARWRDGARQRREWRLIDVVRPVGIKTEILLISGALPLLTA